ncbi:hypothetical protein ACN28I_12765 [Archangium gephyra]|uniref:hypothetical protein n=1 Tax=Archangium gephyra TaxID=48 RepID=UPI003B7DD897
MTGSGEQLQKNNFRKTVGGTSLGGFGFTHDGAIATLDEFLAQPVFGTFSTDPTRRANLTAYLLTFPTGMAPAVGYSLTISSANASSTAVEAEVTLLETQARVGKIDLIIKGKVNGVVRGLYYNPLTRVYDVDAAGASSMTRAQLQDSAAGGELALHADGRAAGHGRAHGHRPRCRRRPRRQRVSLLRHGEEGRGARMAHVGALGSKSPRRGPAGPGQVTGPGAGWPSWPRAPSRAGPACAPGVAASAPR